MFVSTIFRGCGCDMFTFLSLADPIGHAAHLYVLASVYTLFLPLSGRDIWNSTKPSCLGISHFVSNNNNSHLIHVLVLWWIMLRVKQLYESFGRKPCWRFTARCKYCSSNQRWNVSESHVKECAGAMCVSKPDLLISMHHLPGKLECSLLFSVWDLSRAQPCKPWYRPNVFYNLWIELECGMWLVELFAEWIIRVQGGNWPALGPLKSMASADFASRVRKVLVFVCAEALPIHSTGIE